MKLECTYPSANKNRPLRTRLIFWLRWPVLFAAVAVGVVNLAAGGKAWSLIVLFSLYMVWSLAVAPDMVEYNRISQLSKSVLLTALLLLLIDRLLGPGLAASVVPIVCFGGLLGAAALFLTDYDRQRQNMMPMVMLAVLSLISSAVVLLVPSSSAGWEFWAMGGISALLLILLFCYLGGDMVRNLKKHFHMR